MTAVPSLREVSERKPKTKRWLLLLGAVLVIATALQLRPNTTSPQAVYLPSLTLLLPTELAGWATRDLPLGDTELLQRRVYEKLQYDDSVLREYREGNLTITVLVLYWRPEQGSPLPPRAHTPDVCFPNAGWTCAQRATRSDLHSGDYVCKPAEYREFVAGSEKVQMLFWHLRAGELQRGISKQIPRWHARWLAYRQRIVAALVGARLTDEVFIRVTTNGSVEEVLHSTCFQAVAAALAQTGAFRKELGSSTSGAGAP